MASAVALLAGIQAQPEAKEVVLHDLDRGPRPHRIAAARGNDEVVGQRRAPVDQLPQRGPRIKDAGQERVLGDLACHLGLRALLLVAARHDQLGQRLLGAVSVAPANARDLSVPHACERLQGVLHAALRRQPRVGDERDDLGRGVGGELSPLGVLVHLRRQIAVLEHDGVGGELAADHRGLEHPAEGVADVDHGLRREVVGLELQPVREVLRVRRVDLAELLVTELRHDPVVDVAELVLPRRDAGLPTFDPREGPDGHGERRREAGAGAQVDCLLRGLGIAERGIVGAGVFVLVGRGDVSPLAGLLRALQASPPLRAFPEHAGHD